MVGTDRQSGGVSAEKGEKRVILSFTCNGLTRKIQRLENAVVAVRQDSNVDTVRMIFRPEEFNNISLATVSVKFLYVDTNGEIKAYPSGTTPDGGVYVADWELTDDVVDDAGYINFAVKLAVVNGDTIEKQWFSIPDSFRVYDSVDDTNNPPGETAAEQATNAEKIAQLQSQLGTATSELSSLTSTVATQGAALDTLNTNSMTNSSRTCEDCNTATSVGSYRIPQLSTCANTPGYPWSTSFAGELLVYYRGTPSCVFQTLYVYVTGSNDAPWIYHRQQTGSDSWSAWYKAPTRAEIDMLTENLGGVIFTGKFSVTSSGKTLTVPNNYRGVIYITNANVADCGEYFVVASSNGSVRYKAVTASEGLKISTATNALTLTAEENATFSCICLNIAYQMQPAE